MALNDIQPVIDAPSGGGGGLGGIIGAVVGGIAGLAAAPFTGGASVPLTAGAIVSAGATGAGLGNMAGSLVGNAVDPASAGSASPTLQQDTSQPAPMRVTMNHPEVQLAAMQEARQGLQTANLPADAADHYMGMIDSASARLKSRLGIG